MTRNIPTQMAGVLARLELDRPKLVSMQLLETILTKEGIRTPARIVAARLRERGWLLPTAQRGVWEFAPAELAGPYSSADPLLPLESYLVKHPQTHCGLTFQTAAWALGLATRVPAMIEVAFEVAPSKSGISSEISPLTFAPNLPYQSAKGVPTLALESVIVHMAAKPNDVRSWSSALEWLPDIAYEADIDNILIELKGRLSSVTARTGYLLQGLRPDISSAIMDSNKPSSKVRFGQREKSLRNDEQWKISDTLLPFDPRELEKVK